MGVGASAWVGAEAGALAADAGADAADAGLDAARAALALFTAVTCIFSGPICSARRCGSDCTAGPQPMVRNMPCDQA
ncbi:hypothetical protein SDC9_128854 [bioreactor metagenome]|uniref:Uncharacterized protein n=1 Tax=bioreactor metagenome TaxID=1076179 RepID=A0A645CY18_9ZZZZ